jgi:hypothetical protein
MDGSPGANVDENPASLFVEASVGRERGRLEKGPGPGIAIEKNVRSIEDLHAHDRRGTAKVDEIHFAMKPGGEVLLQLPTSHGIEAIGPEDSEIDVAIGCRLPRRLGAEEIHGDDVWEPGPDQIDHVGQRLSKD